MLGLSSPHCRQFGTAEKFLELCVSAHICVRVRENVAQWGGLRYGVQRSKVSKAVEARSRGHWDSWGSRRGHKSARQSSALPVLQVRARTHTLTPQEPAELPGPSRQRAHCSPGCRRQLCSAKAQPPPPNCWCPPTSSPPARSGGRGSPQAEVPFLSFNCGLKENTKLAQTSAPAAPEPLNPLLLPLKER